MVSPNFGLIFHWGVYSVPAYDDPVSAKRRRTQNGSEWYMKRLLETGNYRPISGWKETQAYHKTNYFNLTYYDLARWFNTYDDQRPWNPDEWMDLAVEVGASYVILTAKHHDGFCLWPTQNTSFLSGSSKEDIIGRFKDSAERHGLRFGLYYSWSEFERGVTKDYIDNIMIPQIEELEKYQPSIWWFDGHWSILTKYAQDKINTITSRLKKNGIEVNDRIYGPKDTSFEDPNYLGNATFRVYGDRYIPQEVPTVPWEHINTIGLSWGRNIAQIEEDYKTPEELYDLWKEVRGKNGRFLLNLGPDYNGALDEYEVSALRGFASYKIDQE